MQLQTKFNIGETVWMILKSYSKDSVLTETNHTYFWEYSLSGPHTITKVLIDVFSSGAVNIIYELDAASSLTCNEIFLRYSEADAATHVEIQNEMTNHVRQDMASKYS